MPSAVIPRQGGSYWAVLAAVSTDPQDPALAAAERTLQTMGYATPTRAEIDCLRGARDALRLQEDRQYYEVDVLFRDRAAAQRVAGQYPGRVAGVVKVTAYCLD